MGRGSGIQQLNLLNYAYPSKEIKRTYHVGTMREEDKGSRFSYSYEGDGLSITSHPEEWIRIAKLGGLPIWELTATKPTKFLDYHSLTEQMRQLIFKQMEDYFTFQDVYTIFTTDEEGDEMTYTVDSLQQAVQEIEYGGLEFEASREMRATEKLLSEISWSKDSDAADAVIITWARQHDYHGVWWEDQLGAWSAPRGTIFVDKLDAFNKLNLDF